MTEFPLISVSQLSKRYCRRLKRSLWYGLQDMGHQLLGQDSQPGQTTLRTDEFWALKDVGFEVHRGECLGLVGRNGAGKTTLLRILNGVIRPDQGSVTLRGRVGAVIALGAGFNPVLTGRENILVAASVLGMSPSDARSRFEQIVEFAELGPFIDSPVQTYSSGMQVRLGFSVATSFSPDILLLDEVLAVGDFKFRRKCIDRIQEIRSEAALIFVSHHEAQVRRICNRSVVLESGQVRFIGDTSEAFRSYSMPSADLERGPATWHAPGIDGLEIRLPNPSIQFGDDLLFEVAVSSDSIRDNLAIRVVFDSSSDDIDLEYSDLNHSIRRSLVVGRNRLLVRLPQLRLRSGWYGASLFLFDPADGRELAGMKHLPPFEVRSTQRCSRTVQL